MPSHKVPRSCGTHVMHPVVHTAALARPSNQVLGRAQTAFPEPFLATQEMKQGDWLGAPLGVVWIAPGCCEESLLHGGMNWGDLTALVIAAMHCHLVLGAGAIRLHLESPRIKPRCGIEQVWRGEHPTWEPWRFELTIASLALYPLQQCPPPPNPLPSHLLLVFTQNSGPSPLNISEVGHCQFIRYGLDLN